MLTSKHFNIFKIRSLLLHTAIHDFIFNWMLFFGMLLGALNYDGILHGRFIYYILPALLGFLGYIIKSKFSHINSEVCKALSFLTLKPRGLSDRMQDSTLIMTDVLNG